MTVPPSDQLDEVAHRSKSTQPTAVLHTNVAVLCKIRNTNEAQTIQIPNVFLPVAMKQKPTRISQMCICSARRALLLWIPLLRPGRKLRNALNIH